MKVPNNITMSQYVALLNAISMQCYNLHLAQLSCDMLGDVIAVVDTIDRVTEDIQQ
jgi:hypothetical protein